MGEPRHAPPLQLDEGVQASPSSQKAPSLPGTTVQPLMLSSQYET
jgi:hypothetical protein